MNRGICKKDRLVYEWRSLKLNFYMLKLIQKYLDKETSNEEDKQLLAWVKESESNKKSFLHQIKLWNYSQTNRHSFDPDKAYERFQRQTFRNATVKRGIKAKRVFKYAAIFIAFFSASAFYHHYTTRSGEEKEGPIQAASPTGDFDDEVIVIAEDGTVNKINSDLEELSYQFFEQEKEELVYKTLKTPKGKIFKIVLSDGTKVWLNAATKIKYPQKFLSREPRRIVFLEGEAFFDVSHNNNKPFIVISDEVEIEVLGTKFNVSSYTSGSNIRTTLIDGSVKVQLAGNRSTSVILTPNKQAAYNKDLSRLSSYVVHTREFTAWMEDKLLFENEKFEDLILRIERTYNVAIHNNLPKLNKQKFTGEFDIEKIDEIMKTLSTSIGFKYKIKESTVTIY